MHSSRYISTKRHFKYDDTGKPFPGGALVDVSVPVSSFRIGLVVQSTKFENGIPVEDDRFGHIIGFNRNHLNELCLEVQWEGICGEEPSTSMHNPFNLITWF